MKQIGALSATSRDPHRMQAHVMSPSRNGKKATMTWDFRGGGPQGRRLHLATWLIMAQVKQPARNKAIQRLRMHRQNEWKRPTSCGSVLAKYT